MLADGRLVTASEEENEDLFWAIRGGGGNFGVIASFLFEAHPVYAGPTFWPIEQAADAMRFYRDFLAQAPEEHLHLKTMCGVVWCYTGPQEEAEEAFRPIRQFGPPAFELLGPMPLPALNSMFDPLPPGLQWRWKGDFVNELSDEAIALHVEHGSKIPTMLSTMHLYPVDGAANGVGKDDTAFSYREAKWSSVFAGIDPDPANAELITAWARDYWEALHPTLRAGRTSTS